jgi:putative heme iron utilization protein
MSMDHDATSADKTGAPYVPQNPDDPVSQGAGRAIAHLNADHDDSLLDMARALAGCDEATAARCLDADRFGLTLLAATPSGELTVRVPYEEPIEDAEGLRKATVMLAKRARAILEKAG